MSLEILPYSPDSYSRRTRVQPAATGAGGSGRPAVSRNARPRLDACHGAVSGRRKGARCAAATFCAVRHSPFAARHRAAAHYRLPLSEGIVNRAYATLGLRMVRDALAREPRLYAMGMGGWDKPLPQMLKRLRMERCARCLLTSKCSIPVTISATTFAPPDQRCCAAWRWMRPPSRRGLAGHEGVRPGAPRRPSGSVRSCAGVRPVGGPGLEPLARCLRRCSPSATPPRWTNSIRLRTRASCACDAAGGWAVLLDTQMRDHKQFGDMRVGTIVDCLAPPERAGRHSGGGQACWNSAGVDLIVSNQLHTAWSRALLESGFRTGPSNYLFALSPAFARPPAVRATTSSTSTVVTATVRFISERKRHHAGACHHVSRCCGKRRLRVQRFSRRRRPRLQIAPSGFRTPPRAIAGADHRRRRHGESARRAPRPSHL